MRIKWSGLVLVALIAVALIALKQREGSADLGEAQAAENPTSSSSPSVLLVADLREADAFCGCGEIIRAVRKANKRGVPVQELMPDSQSDLLQRYRVLVFPTVLILDRDGREITRYEGEDKKTVSELRSRLDQMEKAAGTKG